MRWKSGERETTTRHNLQTDWLRKEKIIPSTPVNCLPSSPYTAMCNNFQINWQRFFSQLISDLSKYNLVVPITRVSTRRTKWNFQQRKLGKFKQHHLSFLFRTKTLFTSTQEKEAHLTLSIIMRKLEPADTSLPDILQWKKEQFSDKETLSVRKRQRPTRHLRNNPVRWASPRQEKRKLARDKANNAKFSRLSYKLYLPPPSCHLYSPKFFQPDKTGKTCYNRL